MGDLFLSKKSCSLLHCHVCISFTVGPLHMLRGRKVKRKFLYWFWPASFCLSIVTQNNILFPQILVTSLEENPLSKDVT
jgi:hypothetical protein